jgi:hypothetical protein
MKKDLPDPIVEFTTLVEILRWRALQLNNFVRRFAGPNPDKLQGK